MTHNVIELTEGSLGIYCTKYPHWVPVKVLPEDYIILEAMGHERTENGKKQGFKNRAKDKSGAADIAGIAGEWAASLLYNRAITNITSADPSELNRTGDLEGGIELRASRGSLPWQWDLGSNRSTLKPERIYVHTIACLLPHWVIITGWAYGHEIAKSKKVKYAANTGDDPIYFLEQPLKDPLSLFDIINTPNLLTLN